MNYAELEGINEGMAASDGFLEAIGSRPGAAPVKRDRGPTIERKAELEEQLVRYCRFDTEAMVEILKFFTGAVLHTP
jgi:hypothetical protein